MNPAAGVGPSAATERYLSPNCRTALDPYVPDDCPEGHPKCGHPGYRHPILGWMAIPCTCSCHTAITRTEQEVGADV